MKELDFPKKVLMLIVKVELLMRDKDNDLNKFMSENL